MVAGDFKKGSPSMKKAPKPPPPKPMPDPEDPKKKTAARRKRAKKTSTGRESTMMGYMSGGTLG